MKQIESKYEEAPLEKAVIYRGPQTLARQAYVPLSIFVIECVLLLLSIRFFGVWTVIFLPLHMIPVRKTNEKLYWVNDLMADFNNRWFASNKGQYGKGVVSFTPKPAANKFK